MKFFLELLIGRFLPEPYVCLYYTFKNILFSFCEDLFSLSGKELYMTDLILNGNFDFIYYFDPM